ncbi:MAG: AAA family ATPase, partial [Lachnospiraceae bacterium]|nr:AAA family ATPase [Lachnospiraceae bacterium]
MTSHISLRVPWHDNGWNGCVCSYPRENQACLRLKNIYESRDDDFEANCSECELCNMDDARRIPCVREGGTFMSPDEISIIVEHPYTRYGFETHKHLLPTELSLPPYSYPARPYRWTMKRRWLYNGGYAHIEDLALETGIDYHPEFEPEIKNKTWVQDGRNQKAIFDTFFEDIEPDNSICIFYAKQVPFIEDNRRIVVGIGHVKNVIPSHEYESSDPNGMTSYLWETVISHSIRGDYKDGFLMPYQELMEYAEEHEDFDISRATVYASDDFFEEFSYASEHLSYDAVIDVILQSIKALGVVKECGIEGNWDACIAWLNDALISVWEDRGAFPGLGSMLVAFGVPSGVVVARELNNRLDNSVDLWEMLDIMFDDPRSVLSDFCAEQITGTLIDTWKHLPKSRKDLFQMLSRVTLSTTQADVLYNKEKRESYSIYVTDEELLSNPYLLYERTRDKVEELRISIKKVDLAFFPLENIKNQYPIEAPTKLEADNDKRRVRAIAVSVLENNALNGNTIMPVNNLVLAINDLPIEPKCSVNGDIISAMLDFFTDEIVTNKDAVERDYFKLQRYKKIDRIIQMQVNKRIMSPNRHEISVDWMQKMEEEFGPIEEGDLLEEHARKEKVEALQVLAESRLSVLVGGAGTGKTTVLEFLCREKKIQDGGILLLAPTGKARVRMSQGLRGKAKFDAYTVAQFLGKSGRYDGDTFTYKVLEGKDKTKARAVAVPDTVIIDESSMLTEEMFGAVLDAVGKYAGRIIFVGDTNQLPPIGAGRPFVDLVRYIRSAELGNKMSGKCYARLITTRRQKQEENRQELRADIRLSKWFTETDEQLDDDIFSEIQGGVTDQTIVFKRWTDKEDLENTILETIKEVTGMESVDDIEGFNRSLGATFGKDASQVYFNNMGRDGKGCAAYVDKWQILAPVRNKAQAVLSINHLIHERYRENFLELASRDRFRKIP